MDSSAKKARTKSHAKTANEDNPFSIFRAGLEVVAEAEAEAEAEAVVVCVEITIAPWHPPSLASSRPLPLY
jgi:hypothetical protein